MLSLTSHISRTRRVKHRVFVEYAESDSKYSMNAGSPTLSRYSWMEYLYAEFASK